MPPPGPSVPVPPVCITVPSPLHGEPMQRSHTCAGTRAHCPGRTNCSECVSQQDAEPALRASSSLSLRVR